MKISSSLQEYSPNIVLNTPRYLMNWASRLAVILLVLVFVLSWIGRKCNAFLHYSQHSPFERLYIYARKKMREYFLPYFNSM